MNPKEKNLFYLLWTLAIFVCALLAVFVLIHASIQKTEAPESSPAGYYGESYLP